MRQFAHFSACACLILSLFAVVRSQKPELIIQTGHTDKGLSGQFGLGGKLIVTAGQDHTIKLWNTETGNLLKTFTGFNPSRSYTGSAVRISPDGKQAAAVDLNLGIKILNLETGSESPLMEASLDTGDSRGAAVDHRVAAISDWIFGPDGQHLHALDRVEINSQTTYEIRTWDLGGGKSLWHSLEKADVTPDRLSPDANLILGSYPCANKSKVTVVNAWDPASGRTVFRRSYPGCRDVQFSRDGKLLVMYGPEKITLLEARTGEELSTLDVVGDARDVSFSPNRQFLAAKVQFAQGKTDLTQLLIWEVSSGHVAQRLTVGTGYINDVSLVWSPDDSMIACKMETTSTATSSSSRGMVQVWGVQSGNKIQEFHPLQSELGPFLGPPLDWSPDGNYLVTFGDDGATHLWNPSTGASARTFAGQNRSTDYVAFSPDGNYFVSEKESIRDTANLRATLSIWDLRAGSLLSRIRGQFKAFSRDSKIVVTETKGQERVFTATSMYAPNNDAQDKEDETNLWSVNGGTVLATFPGRFLSLSADNGRLITRSQAKGVVLWDTKTKVPVRNLATYHDITSFAVASEDGTYLVSGWDNAQTINLIDVSSGRTIQSLTGFPDDKADPGYEYVAVFSHDNRLLACRRGGLLGGETLLIWDVKTGALLKKLKAGFGLAPRLAFSPDNRTLISMASEITFIDVQTGKERKDVFGGGSSGYHEEMHGVDMSTNSFYSPDSRFLVTMVMGDAVDLGVLDLRTHKSVAYLNDGTFRAAAFGPDNKTLALVGQDNSIQFWDLQTGRLLVTALDMDEDGWLTITPDGRFDGTSGAWQKIFWRFAGNILGIVPVEVFFGDFYYPSLLSDILSRRNIFFTQNLAAKDRRQPQLKLTLADVQSDKLLTTRNVTVKVDISQAPAGAQDVRLLRNDSLVKVWHGDVLKGLGSVTLEATIPIVAGENRFSAYAFNHDNIKSSDVTLVVKGADDLKRRGTLYVLAIGVNKYQSKGHDLKFAIPDVDEISKQVKAYQDKLGNYGSTEIVFLTDQEATKANIMLALRRFADGDHVRVPPDASAAWKRDLEKIKTIEPEDALVIYYAGHGTAAGEHFYLLPHDYIAKTEEQLKASSVSDVELDEVLERVGAGKLLMVIDACQSGQALGGEKEGRGPMNSKGLAQLAYDKGMYILTAAQSFQAAKEVSRSQTGKEIKHGLLTFVLLEGLSKAKPDGEGRITEREWMNYAVDQVPLMQMEEMKKRNIEIRQRSGPGQRSSELVFVAGDNDKVDPEKRNVQRPRVFYRRELESHPLIVAKP